jgi:ddrB-like ParB superfamily domain
MPFDDADDDLGFKPAAQPAAADDDLGFKPLKAPARPAPRPAAAATDDADLGFKPASRDQAAQATPKPTAAETPPVATISAYKPSILERIERSFTEGIPQFSSRTPANPKYGQAQLVSPEEAMTPLEQRAHPVVTGLGEFAGSLTSPTNAALLAGTGGLGGLPGAAGRLVPRLVSGYFTAEMLHGAYKQVPDLRAAMDRGDEAEAKRIITNMVATGAMAALTGSHAAGVEVPVIPARLRGTDSYLGRLADSEARPATAVRFGGIPLGQPGGAPPEPVLRGETVADRVGRNLDLIRAAPRQARMNARAAAGGPPILIAPQREAPASPLAAALREHRGELQDMVGRSAEAEPRVIDRRAVQPLPGELERERPAVPTFQELRHIETGPSGISRVVEPAERLAWRAGQLAKRGEPVLSYSAREARGLLPPASARAVDAELGFKPLAAQPEPEAAQAEAQAFARPEAPKERAVGAQVPGVDGVNTTLKTATRDIPVSYRVVEANTLTTSHDPITFAENPTYPPGVQERAYHTSKEAQARVIRQAQNYDSSFTVNTNPDAVNGPPVVTPDGIVLGGNSRAMSTARLYREGRGDAYKAHLMDEARTFGVSADEVARMKNPVLVREIAEPVHGIEEARRIGSDLNRSFTGALGGGERAVSAGRAITQGTLEEIDGLLSQAGEGATLREVMRDNPKPILDGLIRDGAISETERPQYTDPSTGGLNEEGKAFIERALMGSVIDDVRTLETAPKSVLGKIENSLADLSRLKARKDVWDISPLVRQALREHTQMASRGLGLDTHLNQRGLFGGERNAPVDAMMRALASKPRELKAAIAKFSSDAGADRPGQRGLAFFTPPEAWSSFNDAFGAKLTQAQFEGGLERALREEVDAIRSRIENRAASPEAGRAAGRSPEITEAGAPGQRGQETLASGAPILAEFESAVEAKPRSESGFATPALLRDVLSGRLPRAAYRKFVAEPLIEKGLRIGDKYAKVAEGDPAVAQGLHRLDNAPSYFRAKAGQLIHSIVGGLSRDQERLFTLVADADSRANLRTNHPDEYRKAINDPAIQDALGKYRPIEQQLTAARERLGGEILDRDYLRRVYDQHVAGIGKESAPGSVERGTTAFDRVVRPQRIGNLSREATAEYHYKQGLHEFGPAFGTKYIGTNLAALRDSIARNFISKATEIEPGASEPRSITYNGEKYYRPDIAREMRDAGQKNIQAFDRYDPTAGVKYPQKGASKYLGPREVVRALNDYGAGGEDQPSPVRRFFQEQVVGFGFGVPHIFNILRRVTQSGPGAALNPRAWVDAWKVAFNKELRARGIAGLNDPTFDKLAQQGAVVPAEMKQLKQYWGGNLNPANWVRALAGVGHRILFEPGSAGGFGGIDQRARIWVADFVKADHPEFSDTEVARAVNTQLGDYNRRNWGAVQKQAAKFMLFPGWDVSSLRWVIEHPIKTTVPPALLVLAANQVLHRLGMNRDEDARDIFNVHVGDRSYGLTVLRESMARNLGRPLLNYAQSRLRGESGQRAIGEAARGITQGAGGLVGTMRPDITAGLDLAMNRRSTFGGQELVSKDDYNTPGRVLPNRALEKQAALVVRHAIPALDRMIGSDQEIDFRAFAGSNLGAPNFKSGPEQRLKRNVAEAMEVSQTLSRLAKTNRAMARQFIQDPDNAAYALFHTELEKMGSTLKRMDDAKDAVSAAENLSAAEKRDRLAQIEKARGNLLRNADGLDALLFKRKEEFRSRVSPVPASTPRIGRTPLDRMREAASQPAGR